MEKTDRPDDQTGQRLDKRSDATAKVSPFVQDAMERMRKAPRFVSDEARLAFYEYEMAGGPVVNGNPNGAASKGAVCNPPPAKRNGKDRG